MTLREQLIQTGRALLGREAPQEVIKEVKAEVEKQVGGFFVDYFRGDMSSETRVSSKLLNANKGWVYRNTDVIAKEVSGIEFELFTTRVVGNQIELRPITTHPILDALDKFNEFTDAGSGFYTTEAHRLLAGNCYWYVEGKAPNVKAIYLLQPDKVEIKLGNVKAGQAVIQNYKYETTIKGQRISETYDPDDIIHHKIPNPNNYFKGLGKVEVAADDIDLDWMAIEANKKIFQRGLIGNFVLTQEKSMTDDQRKQLRAELTTSYAGLNNAFKIPILSGGLKPETIQMTNKDMEFLKQQEWVRDKISSIWGNPKSLITTDDVNRANAEATLLNWKQTTVRQEMKQITDTLNEFLVSKFGKGLILGFKDLVPEDDAKNDDRATNLKGAGVITRNEARELAGYEAVEGGNDFPEPFSPLKPDTEVPKSLKHVNYNKYFRRMGHYKRIDEFIRLKKAAKPLARKIVKQRKAKAKEMPPLKPDTKTYYDKQIQIVEVAEKILQNRIQTFIEKLVRKGLSEVPSEIKEVQSKQLFDDDEEIVRASIEFYPILESVAQAAGDNAMDLIKQSRPYVMTAYRQKIKERVELFTKSMVETDRDKLIDIIADGVRNGEGVPQIRQNITEFFKDYSKSQAERITRTEVLSVSNRAALDAWEQSGVVEGKEWLTAGDPCPECSPYDGKVIYDLGGNFYSIENEFDDGDPPLHPNCRCVVLPIVAEG